MSEDNDIQLALNSKDTSLEAVCSQYGRDFVILELMQKGTHTLQELGELFGISKQRVRQIGARANVTNQRNAVKRVQAKRDKSVRAEARAEERLHREELKEKVTKLRADGNTYKVIASITFGDESLWRRAQEMCLSSGVKRTSKKDKIIFELYCKGMDTDTMCTTTGISQEDLSKIIERGKDGKL